jgi:hypothetical protein
VIKSLILCGIAATIVYIAANIYVPTLDGGYSVASQTVSELSAVNASTRAAWVYWMIPYSVLMSAFGIGIWLSVNQSRRLRIVGVLVIINAFLGFFWPPMHVRGNVPTITDTFHIVWAIITVAIFTAELLLSSTCFGRSFRNFSLAMLLVMVIFGILTALEGPNIAQDLATPNVGIVERISIAAYFVWVVVFAFRILLLRSSLQALTN